MSLQILREEDSEGIAQPSLFVETNSNPKIVTAMYVRAVKPLGLVPDMLRIEHGNEARVMVAAHCTLRQNPDANRYGTSVAK